MSDPEQPKRRLPHFSILLLATIILVGAVIALSLWIPYHREQKILSELTRLNFAKNISVASRPERWQWLADLLGARGEQLFQRVVSFDADDAGADDRCLQLIGQLHFLEALSLGYVDFVEDDITGTPPDKYRITNAGLKQLENLGRLESLSLAYAGISSEALETVGKFTKLRSLSLAGCPIETGLEHLSALTGLERLHLEDSEISDAGLQQIPALPALRVLYLDRTYILSAGLTHIDRLSGLRELSLTQTDISDKALKQVGKLPALEILSLGQTRVTGAGFDALKPLARLETLDLSCTSTTDAGMAHLKHLPALNNLMLSKTRVGDAGVAQLAGSRTLKSLNLDETSITDAALENLAKMPYLESLNLEKTQVTDEGVTFLLKAMSLEDLSLTGTHVTGTSLARLSKELPTCNVGCRLPP